MKMSSTPRACDLAKLERFNGRGRREFRGYREAFSPPLTNVEAALPLSEWAWIRWLALGRRAE